MNDHIHIFIASSSKKDIFYCKICQKLSYKGIISQSIPINFNCKFNNEPLECKFIPFSNEVNLDSENHKKYLEHKSIGVLNINNLVTHFGFQSMILYKSICLMDEIYLKNEVSIEKIEIISAICVLLALKFNECCKSYNTDNCKSTNENDIIYHTYLGSNKKNNKNKANIGGFFRYIKKNINNFIFWEALCLKYLNYNLGKYSAYDYLLLFFRLGLVFCKESVKCYVIPKMPNNTNTFLFSNQENL